MKKIKYSILLILIFTAVFIIGEMKIFYLESITDDFNRTYIRYHEDKGNDEIYNDILNSANKNNIDVFVAVENKSDLLNEKLTIYGTPNIVEYFEKNLDITSNYYESVFMGTYEVHIKELRYFDDYDNSSLFYLTGDLESQRKFKSDLELNYDSLDITVSKMDDIILFTIFGIYMIIILLFILLSIYESNLNKKENALKISYGEKKTCIFIFNIIHDVIFFLLIIIIVPNSLNKFTNAFFTYKYFIYSILVMIVCSIIINLNIYFLNFKNLFKMNMFSKRVLSINYFAKSIVIFLTVVIISTNIAIIHESIRYNMQKDFFQEYNAYSYFNIKLDPLTTPKGGTEYRTEEEYKISYGLYEELFSQGKAVSLISPISYYETRVIVGSRYTVPYLNTKIKILKEVDLKEKIYYILPISTKNDEGFDIEDIITARELFTIMPEENDEYEIIYYANKADIVGISESLPYKSQYVRNPIIILNNYDTVPLVENISVMNTAFGDYIDDVLFNISKEELGMFLNEHKIKDSEYSIKSAYDVFVFNLNKMKILFQINLIFTLLILFLDIIIMYTMIKYEYMVNAQELSLKKVLGYSLVERNYKTLIMSLGINIVTIFISFAMLSLTNFKYFKYILIGGLIILVIEMILSLFFIDKVGNTKIQKILKGGIQ